MVIVRPLTTSWLATVLLTMSMLPACTDYDVPTAPLSPRPGVEAWVMEGTITGRSDPANCLGEAWKYGESSSRSWGIRQDGGQLTIETGEVLSDFPVYSGLVDGLHFDFSNPENGTRSGQPGCVSYFRSGLMGGFSEDRRRLEATETWTYRYTSGVESTITWRWSGSRVDQQPGDAQGRDAGAYEVIKS